MDFTESSDNSKKRLPSGFTPLRIISQIQKCIRKKNFFFINDYIKTLKFRTKYKSSKRDIV